MGAPQPLRVGPRGPVAVQRVTWVVEVVSEDAAASGRRRTEPRTPGTRSLLATFSAPASRSRNASPYSSNADGPPSGMRWFTTFIAPKPCETLWSRRMTS